MTAREMFKKLGFEQTLNDSDFIFYEKVEAESCHTRFMFALESRSFEAIFYVDGYGGGGYFIELDEFKVILKQMEELGWIEEKPETNYEHYKDEIIEDSGFTLALVGGKPCKCSSVNCSDCGFSTGHGCSEKIKEWLASTYEKTTYKLTQCEYDMLDTIFEKEARFSTVYLIGELKKKGYFENIKCDSKVLVKDILANCEVIE